MDQTAREYDPYTDPLLERTRAGDEAALGELFTRYRPRLRRMVEIRMDRRLRGRVDASDVLQEAWLDVGRRFPDWVASPDMPLYFWVRFLALQKLAELTRRHLGAKRRDAGREVRLHAGPRATSISIAEHLVGSFTSPSQGAARTEMQDRLVEALEAMEPIDREVLTLRHFEELTNNEVAEVLGLSKAAASNRYVRALRRLREILPVEPGGAGGAP